MIDRQYSIATAGKVKALDGLVTDFADLLDDAASEELDAREAVAREAAAKKDVLAWGKALFPDKFSLPFCQLHQDIVNERHEPFISREAPRFHSKTTTEDFLNPMFIALEESGDPDTAHDFFLNVQATETKALALNSAMAYEFEWNELLRRMYGDMVGTHKWTDRLFVLKNDVAFAALGTGQSLRGIQYRNRRPNYINVDDIYDEEDINNIESTRKKNSWFWGSLFMARARDRKSCIHVQGTAINKEDLLERLKKDKRFKSRSYRAVMSWQDKKMLWPQSYSFEEAEKDRKSMGEIIFNREMQNERKDEKAAIIHEDWLQNWEYDPNTLRFDQKFLLLRVMITCDPSIGKKEENDPSGFAVILKCQRQDGSLPIFYIDSLHNELLSLQARLDIIKRFIAEYGGRYGKLAELVVIVETIAGFKDFGDMVAGAVTVPCETVDRVPDKITNLEKKSYLFQNGRVFLNKFIDTELKEELVAQLTTNYPGHDDMRDAVLLGFNGADEGIWNY